jgi:hypothetical protein
MQLLAFGVAGVLCLPTESPNAPVMTDAEP